MRGWMLGLVGALLLAPLGAGAQVLSGEEVDDPAFAKVNAHPAECARLRRQIDHYRGMQQRAKALDNPMWETRTKDQVDLLRGMQAARCPGDIPVDTTAEALKQLIKLAAKGAALYFSGGLAGF